MTEDMFLQILHCQTCRCTKLQVEQNVHELKLRPRW